MIQYATNPNAADRLAHRMRRQGHSPRVHFGRAVGFTQFCWVSCAGCPECAQARTPNRFHQWLDRILWRIYAGQ